MTDDRLHVAIPYVGRADYLRQTVNSLLRQTDPDWVMTIVEDGEQEAGVGKWLRRLDDPRINHVVNSAPLGLPGNFQRCLDLATGQLVCFPGCDDLLLPEYVRTVRSLMRSRPTASAVQPGVRVIDASGEPLQPLTDRVKGLLAPGSGETVVLGGEQALRSLLHGNWTYFPAICWRRDHVAHLGFRQDLPTTLDLALLARLLLDGHEIVVSGSPPVFQYRRHRASASSSSARDLERFAEERRLFAEIADQCRRNSWFEAARAARWHASSRLHAATMLPNALVSLDSARSRAILRHIGFQGARGGPRRGIGTTAGSGIPR